MMPGARYLLVLLFACLSCWGFAQAQQGKNGDSSEIKSKKSCTALKDTCITLDALNCCANVHIGHYLKEGARVSLKIKNVNPMAASLVATASTDTFDFSVPAVFDLEAAAAKEDEEEKEDEKKQEPLIGLERAKVKADIAAKLTEQQKMKFMQQYKNCYNELQTSLYDLQQLGNLEPRMKQLLSIPITSREALQRKIEDVLKCFPGSCDTCCCWYQERYIALLETIRVKSECIGESYDSLTKYKSTARKLTLKGTLKSGNDVLTVKDAELQIAGDEVTGFDTRHKKLVAFIDNVLNDSIRKAMDGKIASLTAMCQDFNSTDKFELCKNLPMVSGDVYTINALVKGPRGDTLWHVPEIPFNTYGGFRLNFSTGFGFSLFNLGRNYFKENVNDSIFTIQPGNNRDWIEPTVTAFIHAYRKVPGYKTQWAASFGISTNAASIEATRFFAGASIIQGESRRFIISAGVTVGAVKRLKDKFEADKEYAAADFTGLEDADLTEKKLGISAFIGISYNLSNRR